MLTGGRLLEELSYTVMQHGSGRESDACTTLYLLVSMWHTFSLSVMLLLMGSVKVLHLNGRLVQDNKGEYFEGVERGVFEVFKDNFRVAD